MFDRKYFDISEFIKKHPPQYRDWFKADFTTECVVFKLFSLVTFTHCRHENNISNSTHIHTNGKSFAHVLDMDILTNE